MAEAPALVYSTTSYDYFRDRLCRSEHFEPGEVERRDFPDGEHYRRIATNPDDRDVVLVAGTVDDTDTLELYDLACGLVYYGARRLTIAIPFFGYSTMERAVRDGEVVTAKTRARLLSGIPVSSLGNRVLLLDLHVSGLPHYFENELHPVHIYGSPVISRAAGELGGDDYVLACTDAGRAKWVESLANEIGVTPAFVYKRRLSSDTTEVTAVSARVSGKSVVIYDDMIRTGGSVLSAAEAYAEAGATSISAICTHGIFPGDALERLEKHGVLEKIVCTNSHPRAVKLESSFLEVKDVVPLFDESLRRRP